MLVRTNDRSRIFLSWPSCQILDPPFVAGRRPLTRTCSHLFALQLKSSGQCFVRSPDGWSSRCICRISAIDSLIEDERMRCWLLSLSLSPHLIHLITLSHALTFRLLCRPSVPRPDFSAPSGIPPYLSDSSFPCVENGERRISQALSRTFRSSKSSHWFKVNVG